MAWIVSGLLFCIVMTLAVVVAILASLDRLDEKRNKTIAISAIVALFSLAISTFSFIKWERAIENYAITMYTYDCYEKTETIVDGCIVVDTKYRVVDKIDFD